MSGYCHAERASANEKNSWLLNLFHVARFADAKCEPLIRPTGQAAEHHFYGLPSCASFKAAISAPLQCGPAQ